MGNDEHFPKAEKQVFAAGKNQKKLNVSKESKPGVAEP
jgi:hypothetical protein